LFSFCLYKPNTDRNRSPCAPLRCFGWLQYKLPVPWATMEGDYVGFTNEGVTGPISYTNTADQETAFVSQNATSTPNVGSVFTFNGRLQSDFAIAVQLSTRQFVSLSANFAFSRDYLLRMFDLVERKPLKCSTLYVPSYILKYRVSQKRSHYRESSLNRIKNRQLD